MLSNLEKEISKRRDVVKIKEDEVKIAAKNRKEAKDNQKRIATTLKQERDKLKEIKKGTKAWKIQNAIVNKLAREQTANNKTIKRYEAEMVRLTKEIKKQQDLGESDLKLQKELKDLHNRVSAEERKYGKIKREILNEERRLGRELSEQEKRAILDLKEKNRLTQEYTRHIDEAAEKIGGTLKNAFVIGTAAIAALNYKLMAVVQGFQEFEKQLINANSIWQESNETLFAISDSVVEFGLKFGVEMNNATSGLYQYASAGVSAAEAMMMLQHTLKLSMAVQGDHNTLSKLTTQTIMGFNMEFSQAEEVTDKFAHAINKSLIEWDDLASSIKFALPFFISTGQSLDQLLGGLQVLTNRALEAGIAGRGLRQALAEFTQHADDNSAAFRKLGIEIMDLTGNMKPLNIIAEEFASVMGDGVTDMEVMIALMEDLNVRGATAFVHLVQNADEFTAAVDDLANSQGSAHEMAMIQQESLVNQIQVVKTALMAPFLLSDKIGQEAGYLNEFAMEIHGIVDVVEGLFVQTLADGSAGLTEIGEIMRDFVIGVLHQAKEVLIILVDVMRDFGNEGHAMTGIIKAAAAPLRVMIKIMALFGPGLIEAIVAYKILNGLIPLNSAILATNIGMVTNGIKASIAARNAELSHITMYGQKIQLQRVGNHWIQIETGLKHTGTKATNLEIEANTRLAGSKGSLKNATDQLIQSQIMQKMVMMGAMLLTQRFAKDNIAYAAIIGGLAGAYMGLAIAANMANSAISDLTGTRLLIAAGTGFAIGAAFNIMLQQMMKPPDMSEYGFDDTPLDLGGRFMPRRGYDMGGRYTQEHGMAILQKGETVIPKTQNMLSGASGGITLNIHGDVYDGDNFAQKISEVLPLALRKTNDIGGI
jgi:TP901 family phage tail tape measure protein